MKSFFYILVASMVSATALAQGVDFPEGLDDFILTSEVEKEDRTDDRSLSFDVAISLDTRIGARLQNDPDQKSLSLAETRMQFSFATDFDVVNFNVIADVVFDAVANEYAVDLETGRGFLDVRAANMVFSPFDFMDVKIGRQILTWGVGDLIFINDLFAKDYNSFFIGREDEYLKAPSDALKTALFFGDIGIDIAYVPKFDADRFIDGSRISFFERGQRRQVGRSEILRTVRPNRAFKDDEISVRLYRAFGVVETAAYYYGGFWKSPAGQDVQTGFATFPKLKVYGASARTPLGKGIGTVELGYYESEDGAAVNQFVRNNEFRFLVGYEQEIGQQLTASVQYYLENKNDYTAYLARLPQGAIVANKNRHVVTARVTKMLKQQDLKLSLFNFYSPSDNDGYIRFNAAYKLNDRLRIEAGGNVFYGQSNDRFFSQFKDASNMYTGVHYDF